jgi:TonB family protein
MPRYFRVAGCLILALGVSFLIAGALQAQEQQSSPTSDAVYRDQIHALAGRILKRADKAKCRPGRCAILVANFTVASGFTSRLGMQLADALSAELDAQGRGIQIVERGRLRSYLEHERIPSKLLKDREAACWLATQLSATAVLTGTIERAGDRWNLLVELLNVSNAKIGPEEATDISIADPQRSLDGIEPFEMERSISTHVTTHGSAGARAGVNGAGVPMCIYCPPPSYPETARKAKFQGTVVLQVTVETNGRADNISVLRGSPFGFNEEAIKAVSLWKFRPASGEDGKPVSVLVPIEVTFRLY